MENDGVFDLRHINAIIFRFNICLFSCRFFLIDWEIILIVASFLKIYK